MNALPRLYEELGAQLIPRVRLDDDEYARALQRFIGLCTDAMIFDPSSNMAYLARRRAKPMSSWWIIGGARMPCETPEASIVRCFKRETGLNIASQRFQYVCRNSYLWKDRQQYPQTVSCHMESDTFSVVLSEEERAAIVLDKDEYEEGGLRGFTAGELAGLVSRDAIHQPLLDIFCQIRMQLINPPPLINGGVDR